MGAIATSPAFFRSLYYGSSRGIRDCRNRGILLTGCYGPFGQPGVSVPNALDDAQTVSDAADALVAHRSSATDNARAAIGVANGMGSFIRDISHDEMALRPCGRAPHLGVHAAQLPEPRAAESLPPHN